MGMTDVKVIFLITGICPQAGFRGSYRRGVNGVMQPPSLLPTIAKDDEGCDKIKRVSKETRALLQIRLR